MVSYKITKIVNNNIVCATDSDNSEIILRGLGIGFQKKKNDFVPASKVEKIYRISNTQTSNKLQELLGQIPIEHIEVCTEIIEYAVGILQKPLNDNIYITLTDHISFAIQRIKEKLCYRNALLWEIKTFYPTEYQIGIHALEIIKERLNESLSVDEAGFIALHFVNAQLNTAMSDTMQITEMISAILNITKNYYELEFAEDELNYQRFVTHLKFFGQRLFNNKFHNNDDPVFHQMIKDRYFTDYHCAEEIRDYINETYHHVISDDEMVFLTIHLRRVSSEAL